MSNQLLHQITAIGINPKGTYIFAGTDHEEKRHAILGLARKWHCNEQSGCIECKQITYLHHPDIYILEPEDTKSIGIAQTKTLINDLAKKQYSTKGRRLIIIQPAELLTVEAQNSLLKLLEELPPNTNVFLLVEHIDQLLPTIRSRAQVINFGSGVTVSTDLLETIQQCLKGSAFERLMYAQSLEKGSDTVALVATLSQYLSQKAREAAAQEDFSSLASVARQQNALEQFVAHTAANVPLKTALAGLALAL